MESPAFRHVVVRHIDDCPTEEWTSHTRGSVRWWELFGGDATEIYVTLSGEGDVVIEGNSTPVREGSAVWIPEGLEHYAHNTGPVPLRLLYMFARDKFSDVTYSFPGEN